MLYPFQTIHIGGQTIKNNLIFLLVQNTLLHVLKMINYYDWNDHTFYLEYAYTMHILIRVYDLWEA